MENFKPLNLDPLLEILGLLDKCEEKPAAKAPSDAIKDACTRYCNAHDCADCDIFALAHGAGDDQCVIATLSDLEQPVESAISIAMHWAAKHPEDRQPTYLDDYLHTHPGAVEKCVNICGHSIPGICRAQVYEGSSSKCPGDKPCWVCWNEKMQKAVEHAV